MPLDNPIPLAIGACYNACTGFSGSFPDTNNQFGVRRSLQRRDRQRAAVRILRPVRVTASAVFHVARACSASQAPTRRRTCRSNGSTPPTTSGWTFRSTTTPPAGTSYRLWPSYPTLPGQLAIRHCGLHPGDRVPACRSPARWTTSGSTPHPARRRCRPGARSGMSARRRWYSGTDNTSPSWSGAAGSGWVCVRIQRRHAARRGLQGGGVLRWRVRLVPGHHRLLGHRRPGASGITAGPVTAPGTSAATSPGQSTYNEGSWAYPQTYGTNGNGENYWVDVEVTPT